MGKSWKNAGIAANAAKKGAKTTKLAREIQVATKLGGAEPESNPRLRAAIDAARAESVTKDTIERAIKRGSGQLDDGAQIEEISYEGYAPHQVAIIVECQSDNRNRTSGEIRNAFNKRGGRLGEIGSVAWMFDRVALVEATKADVTDAEEDAIEAGANEVEKHDETYSFYGEPTDLKAIEGALTARGWTVKAVELSYKAKNMVELSEADKKEVLEFIHYLDDNDDTHRIYSNVSL